MEKQHQMLIDKQEEEQGKRDVQQVEQQPQLNPSALPPSSSSSPSHEFSFTISLHPPPAAAAKLPEKSNSPPPPPLAVDLTPADEIFFHGHLLPLHLFSHLPVSPRSSTNSLDSFTLPIKEPSQNSTSDDQYSNSTQESSLLEGKGRGKSKSFSLFGLPRLRKGCEAREKDHQERQKGPNKSKFDISNVVKRYMRLVKPFLSFRNRKGNPPIHRQPYSFSGNLQMKSKKEMKGRKRDLFSAPASMKTSPTNSGLLVASGTLTPTTSDSTMEELQAAIQAAIAHCKNSIATEDKIKLP